MTKLSKVFYFLTRLRDTHARKANPKSERAGGSQYWTGGEAGLEARNTGLAGRLDLRLEMRDLRLAILDLRLMVLDGGSQCWTGGCALLDWGRVRLDLWRAKEGCHLVEAC